MKKLLSFLVLMCVSLSAMAMASNTSVKNADGVDIWYDFNSSAKTASVTYRGSYYDSYSDEYSGEVVIPSTVTYEGEKYSVTSIGDDAFAYCRSLTSITIPEGVTSIGNGAFAFCSSLTSITLPEGLTSIGNAAFAYCRFLTSITIPEGVTLIGESAFNYCTALTSITIPEGVTSIGDYAFNYCTALTSITLPEGVSSIGNSAFEDCSSLTSITLPKGVTSIGKSAFRSCTALTSITLPKGVESIGDYAFYDCSSLTSITLPEGLTSIGKYAFNGCYSLTSITLPEGLTSIGYDAFYNCYKLYEVYNKSDLTITAGNSDNGYVAYYAKNVYTDSEGESKLKTVGDYIFYADGEDIELIAYTGGETSITLPSDYEGKNYNIGDYAFYKCDALTSITLPESLTSIGDYAFAYCYSLTSITLPESVMEIGDDAFQYCYKLYEVYNKSDLTITAGSWKNGYVAYYAKNVYTDSEGESKLKTVGDYIFYVDGEDIELIAYTGSETSITLPSDYEGKNYKIGYRAFYECDALTSITITDGVTSIGDDAFRSCDALASITLPESLTSIGEAAFYECDALTSITLPERLTSIGVAAFYYCSALTSITLPEGVTSIGGWTFAYCSALTSITLPESLTSIGEVAFYECDALTSITLPESLTSIGDEAFAYCDALTSITIPEGVTSIGDYAFCDCYSLTSITLPEGVTSIGKRTFAYCYSLTSITIPEGLTSIGDYAFYYCDALTSITSKNTTPPTIGGKYTFDDVDKSIPVYVPKSSVDTYKSAEYWKDFTNIVGAYFVDVIAENGTVEGAGAYEENAEATLTVTPAEGYKFVKWSDGVTDNPRTVVVVSDTTFTTEFEIKEYTLTTEAENGTVEGAGTYKHGDEATLTATPAEGYKFVQWSDGVKDNHRTIVVVSDMTLTAVFELKKYTLTTEAENGTVEGAGTYKHGDKATLTATPAEGYKFVQWSDGVKDNHRTIVVVSDMTLTAVFELKEYTLTTDAENGTVEGAGTYKHGDKAKLTATPAEGYKFVQWSDGVTDNPRTVVVVSDTTFTAEFEIDDTPISDIQTSDVNVRLIGNRVVVEGADDYTVYSISGQNLGKVESVERGIYIVVVNGKSFKVVAK